MVGFGLRGTLRAATGACMLAAVPSSAAVITVTPSTFAAAVAAERGGDTLRLVGNFTAETLTNRTFAAPVTIDATRATFNSTLTLNNVQNLTVLGGTFNIAGDPRYTRAINVYGGRNVTINGARVNGSAGGEGVVFNQTRGATLTNSSFRGLQVGAVFGSVTAGSATHNTVVGAVSDGIDIANSHNITAAYNSCSGETPGPGVHPDCIQLWSVTGSPLQSDIIVSNNSAIGATQGFTAFDSMGGELRVQLIHNTVDSSYPQGIACYGCIDSSISYNNVMTLPGANYRTSISVVDGVHDTVVGNYIASYTRPLVTSDAFFLDAAVITEPVTPDLALLVGPSDFSTQTAVPELPAWAMIITGFFGVGLVRRRAVRSRRTVSA